MGWTRRQASATMRGFLLRQTIVLRLRAPAPAIFVPALAARCVRFK